MNEPRKFTSLDLYSRKARLTPVFIVVLPVATSIVALPPKGDVGWASLIAIATTFGLGVLGAEIGRDLGKNKERHLTREWNGMPTVRMLRHRDLSLNAETKRRYHKILGALVNGVVLPSPDDEAANPERADRVYDSCVAFLRERTRDRDKFGLLFEENASYGFRRNLWAMRPVGIALALAGIVASGLSLLVGGAPIVVRVGALALNAFLLALWTTRFTSGWVHSCAISYSDRLLGACDILSADTPFGKGTSALPHLD